jgi:hypothetical protein
MSVAVVEALPQDDGLRAQDNTSSSSSAVAVSRVMALAPVDTVAAAPAEQAVRDQERWVAAAVAVCPAYFLAVLAQRMPWWLPVAVVVVVP